MWTENTNIDVEFAKRIAKELSDNVVKQVKEKIEEDFLKRKEENDKYFYH
jgi:ribosome-associated toxin RatA of RatAB toxin-antitoxin module